MEKEYYVAMAFADESVLMNLFNLFIGSILLREEEQVGLLLTSEFLVNLKT